MKKTGKHRVAFFKRTLSIFLAIILLVSNFYVSDVLADITNDSSTNIDFSGYQAGNLDIYNYLYYSSANAEIKYGSGSYKIAGVNKSHDIVIGNHPIEVASGEKNDTKPLNNDIPVYLSELEMTNTMTIKPVGETNDYKVVLTSDKLSSLGSLVVEDNANLELTLNADITIGSITLGQNSTLTVNGQKVLTVTGTFNGQGTVLLNGGTINANSGISSVNLSLDNTTVNAGNSSVTATGTLSMHSSTVEDALVFGYSSENNVKVLTLTGSNAFSNVMAVGCAKDSTSIVTLEGMETISSTRGTTYYCDYTISYKTESSDIAAQADWPMAYRVGSVSDDLSKATIQGYHTASGFTEAASVQLPSDSMQSGYVHRGWKLNDTTESITAVSNPMGNITLTAILEKGTVFVKLDSGFDPSIYTNDPIDGKLPERNSTIISKLDAVASLPIPVRFGYKFVGWRITSGTNTRDLLYHEGSELTYTVELNDCVFEDKNSVVTMEALWTDDTFHLTLFLGSDVDVDDHLYISVDGGNTFHKYKELGNVIAQETGDASLVQVSGRTIQFSSKSSIKYGQTISDYLKGIFKDLPEGTLPILKDSSAAGTAQTFAGWSNVSGAIDGASRFLYGEGGVLVPGNMTLDEYHNSLHENNAAMNAVWGVMSYGLTLPDTMPTGWNLVYTDTSDNEHTISEGQKAGTIQVPQDSKVTLYTSSTKPENFSLWNFVGAGNKISPTEQSFNSGDPYLNYQFEMPAANVTATYNKGKEIWINIAKSPIQFEQNFNNNNRNVNGFWYADEIDGMTPLFKKADKKLNGTDINGTALSEGTYFYQWYYTDKFCVTSNSKATQNQLTLVDALAGGIYFKDINLAMRDAYINNANGSLLNGVDCESSIKSNSDYPASKVEEGLKNVNLDDYANIVVNNSTWQSYTTALHFRGTNNTVGAIMQDKLQISSNYKNPLTLKGLEGGAVNLGTAFGNFEYTVSDITVTEYTKSNDFKYLFYCANQTGCKVKNAVIQAQHKNVHAGCMTDTNREISFTDSTADLYSICVFRTLKATNSYLRIRESLRLGILPIYIAGGSKVVIDGNMEMSYHHWADSDKSEGRGTTDGSPDNWLVVKGTFCDMPNRTWRAGTLICNSLVLGREGGIKGGTVITNQIINQAVGFWSYDPNSHTYGYNKSGSSQTKLVNSHYDDYPFSTYHHKSENFNSFTFSGGKIYLLGYYKTNGKEYDSTVKAMSDGNPVAQFMAGLFDENGDLVENPTVNTAEVQTAVENSSLKNNECVVLGNSENYYGSRRSVEISGNAEIYAAGNMTFYNNTTVNGGKVYCNGSFGSKGDLTINNGSITADTVGNAYYLTTTMDDGTIRWKHADIQGGTITADRIGPYEKRVSDSSIPADVSQRPKSSVTIGAGATIVGNPHIHHDVYINYIFDSNLFDNNGTPKNQNNMCFDTDWEQGKTFENQLWINNELQFTSPRILGETGATGNWNWDDLNGNKVTSVSDKGIPQNEDGDLSGETAYNRIQMKLYAVKDSYNLIFKAGADKIQSITCNGQPVTPTQNANGETIASAFSGKEVILELTDPTMASDKTVLWYIDGSNIIHNVMPTKIENGKIYFNMPSADVEIYITNDLTLDLDITSYTLLQDGFRVEANATPTRTDSTFHYLGNLVIHQGRITQDIKFNIDNFGNEQMQSPGSNKQTTNKILVDKDFDNTTNGSRTVTLRRIYQNGTTTSYGIDLEVGAKAKFLLDGAIRLCRIHVPSGSDFTLDGINSRDKDALYPIYNGDALRGDDIASIGNFDGTAGNITLQDLTILGRQQGMFGAMGYSKYPSENTVKYINCRYKSSQLGTEYRGWYNRSYFAYNAENVIFDGCEITLKISRDWPGSFCDQSKDVIIRNGSKITVKDSGSTETDPARPFYLRIKNSLKIDNATLDLSLRVPDDGKTYRVYQGVGSLPKEIQLTNNATMVLEQRARLKKLVIGDKDDGNNGDSSTVKVGQTGTGYLLCEDIQVNDSTKLEAGGVIVSGFYNGQGEFQTETQFLTAMAQGKYIFDGKASPGLEVNGGTVTAKEYITGDVNGKITVTEKGGVVNAPKIGTTGSLYGYTSYVPRADEKYIYTYNRLPVGMNININGGQVNVGEYLGGMRSTVNINGGEVNLAENAIIGLTPEQKTLLYNDATANKVEPANFGSVEVNKGTVSGKQGSISVPYGTVLISGAETGVDVHDMTAECGDITITGVTGKYYDNVYTGSDRIFGHDKVGVYVENSLSAKNLTITGNSVIYADQAYIDVPVGAEGDFVVTKTGLNKAYLYTSGSYGVKGDGVTNYDYDDGIDIKTKNVFGTKLVNVHYIVEQENVILDDDVSRIENPNLDPTDGLPYYVVSTDTTDARYYQLKDAVCSGYEFLGWYEYDPETNDFVNDTKLSRVDRSNSKDLYLAAKWAKVNVAFEIRIKLTDEKEVNPDTMEKVPGEDGVWRFKETASVTYGDQILSKNGVVLSNYTTNTLGILEVKYKDGIIRKDSKVTSQMADDFVKNGGETPLVLMVTDNGTQIEHILITLDQNKDSKGRPEGTSFNLSEGVVNSGTNASRRVNAYDSITVTLGHMHPFADSTQPNGLIRPSAPGYTFSGWYTDKECRPENEVTKDTTLKSLYDANKTTLYAKWVANTYIVQFCVNTDSTETVIKDNRWVTVDNSAPSVDQQTNSSLNYYWVYDTAPNTVGKTFWVKGEDGSDIYKDSLPRAWREGYVFKEWQFTDSKNRVRTVGDSEELKKAIIENLDVENYVGKSDTAEATPALKLYAHYVPVTVNYELNGGNWTAADAPTQNPEYGSALAGYTKESEITGITDAEYTKLGQTTSADRNTKYCVVSTTSKYFSDNSDYVQGDYRDVLSRKGYTFNGWEKKDSSETGTYYGCTPRFSDLNLVAKWTANSYDLTLNVKDVEYGSYESAFSNPDPSTVKIKDVVVDSPISAGEGVWPDKSLWYACNKSDAGTTDDTKLRYMLGVTFAGLDPGDSANKDKNSTYMKYADAVTNMLNSKTIFKDGDVFFLPDDTKYSGDLNSAGVTTTRPTMTTVPDYPTGSNIQMYGIYRERSLVFIEQYVDEHDELQSKIMYSHPWNDYTRYPFDIYPNDPNGDCEGIEAKGYNLIGWYVGSDTIDEAMKYPEDAEKFNDKIDDWKNNATFNGYDINVYTAYAAQQTIAQELTANDNPTEEALTSVAYPLPASMREGKLSYQLLGFPSGLNLVSKEDMENHKYDFSWESSDGKNCNANNAVAIELRVESADHYHVVDLKNASEKQLLADGHHVGKNYKITLTLYHSNVMTEAKDYPFTINYTFEKDVNGTNALAEQWIKDNVTVKLVPSNYNVDYQINLPEEEDKLTITQPDSAYDKVDNVYKRTVNQGYSSNLLGTDKILKVEGYEWNGKWNYECADSTTVSLTDLDLDTITPEMRKNELSDGRVTVYAEYAAIEYSLAKDSTVPDNSWTIKYGNGAADNTTVSTLGNSSADVKYHSTVTFIPYNNQQAAAYINLTYTDSTGSKTERLDHYAKAQADGSYTFAMPATDVTVSYSHTMYLYLDNGTIELFPDGFKQVANSEYGDKLITWPGDYKILQSEDNNTDFHTTENVLKLSGDLTTCSDGTGAVREIDLGRLNIISDNSIELVNTDAEGNPIQTMANLTQQGNIEARNVLVPDRTSLMVSLYDDEDTDKNATISLTPNTDRAAIGATAADDVNGGITLNNVDVTMKLQAPSVSSGIGPGSQNSTKTYGAVMIADSSITVKESSSASGQYNGAWIGGAGVASVNVSNTTILNSPDSNNHRAKAINGNTVNLTNCNIGNETNAVIEPIYAMSVLNIKNCNIYQNNNYNLSTVSDDNYGLSGVSMIGTSDVGTTTIENSTVKVNYGGNGKTAKLFTGQMMIKDPQSDVTIAGTQIIEISNGDVTINNNEVIQASEKHSSDNELNYLFLEEGEYPANASNIEVKSLGNNKTITVQQPVQSSDASSVKNVTVGELNVNNDAKLVLNGNLVVTGNAEVANEKTLTVDGKSFGINYQSGLSGEGSYIQTDGSLTAQNDVAVKGNMTLTNVTANCSDNNIGSNGGSAETATTVTIDGGSITAKNIGALGAHNETFTFVKLINNPVINGTLVQDHYRLTYILHGINVELKDENNVPLPTVLRTESVYTAGTSAEPVVLGKKPANPSGSDESKFNCWYILNDDGTKRLALRETTESLPQGIDDRVLLNIDTNSAGMSQPSESDKTRTLSVFAWLNVTGEAKIIEGRLFESFDNGKAHADISNKGAWTVQLTSNAGYVSGRDYQVTFSNTLPAGTDLTLTVIRDTGCKYYHYTLKDAKNSVSFSDFFRMGTIDGGGIPPALIESETGNEVFLISADFADLPDNSSLSGGNVGFNILFENDTNPMSLGSTSNVSYGVTPVVNGKLEAASGSSIKVITPPSGDERYAGKTVYLVGNLSKSSAEDTEALKMAFDINAVLSESSGTQIDGQWLSGNTVVFPLGRYEDLSEMGYTFDFENLPEGSYSVEWKLCAGDVPNMRNSVCSNSVTDTISSDGQTRPMLDVTTDKTGRVLAKNTVHEISFNYTTTAQSFTVAVEKQTTLANFGSAISTPKTVSTNLDTGVASGTVKAEIPAEPGVYRVRFSMVEGSKNDDVYYSFIVK